MVKFGNPNVETQVRKILEGHSEPVSIDLVAFHLKVGWGTARSILLNMALKGEIKFLKTSKGFIFWLSASTLPKDEVLKSEPDT
jgi:hypothetical protein